VRLAGYEHNNGWGAAHMTRARPVILEYRLLYVCFVTGRLQNGENLVNQLNEGEKYPPSF
jgi:hypothetical protein